jgi:hypothetical protein
MGSNVIPPLPEGYTLDIPPLPPGFVLDPPADSVGKNTLDVLGELAAGANRSAMWIPDTAISAVNLIPGVDIPTLTEGVEAVTGQRPGQGGYMEPGMARDAVAAAGEVLLPGAAGLKTVAGRNLANPAEALAEIAGFGSAAPTRGVAQAASDVVSPTPVVPRETPPALQTNLDLKRGVPDVATAPVMLNETYETVANPLAQETLKQGVDPGRVAQISAASPRDKASMLEMLRVKARGLRDRTYGDRNRSTQVIGDVITTQLDEIATANSQAGKEIGRIAREELKNAPYNAEPAMGVFQSGLDELGVRIVTDPDTGKKALNFTQSQLNQVPEAQKYINRAFQNLIDQPLTTGQAAHNYKKFIDELVSYGKQGEGITGKAEGFLKQFRSAIDTELDSAYPAYNAANTTYSETIDALNSFGTAVGKRVDPENPRAVGLVGRRLLSNAVSQPQVEEALMLIDQQAKKLGGQSGQDLHSLFGYAAELDRLMGASAPNTFAGQISAAAQDAGRVAKAAKSRGGVVDLAIDAGVAAADKARNINQEQLIKSLEALLKQ